MNIDQIIAELERRKDEAKMDFFKPYAKQRDFIRAQADHRQTLMLAANRVGKTHTAAHILAFHLTGLYPGWWDGKRFKAAQDWWVVGKSSETTRQILQAALLGPVGNFGTGAVPKHRLDFESLTDAKKAATGISSFRVLHETGKWSTVELKSAEQGRQAFEGTARSIWLDEDCPEDIYTECLLRTMTGDNILMMTFTPLKGPTPVVMSFIGDDIYAEGTTGLGKHVTRMTWEDAHVKNGGHLTQEAIDEMTASTPAFQREARSKGIPALGSGTIFPISEDDFAIDPFEIPKHWKKAYGFDVGRNTAAIWIAEDPDSKQLYTYAEYFSSADLPSTHSGNIQLRGKWIKGAIDGAARGRSATDGENLFKMYEDLGLNIVNADKAVEAGLYDMLELLMNGRLKVFKTCAGLLQEMRMYRRDEKGNIVKKDDHRMDAWRYAIHTRDKVLQTELDTKPKKAVPYYSGRSTFAG